MIRTAWIAFARIKRRRYIDSLRAKGLRLGESSSVEDGFFFDPSHCYLISIGERCTLAPNVRLIAHDASMRRYLGVTRLAPIVIEDDCFIGDSTIVLPGVTIGRGSIIGAASVVTRSIPPASIAVGNPAKVIGNADEYRGRQRELVGQSKTFSPDYWIGSASPEQIKEIVEAARTTTAFIS